MHLPTANPTWGTLLMPKGATIQMVCDIIALEDAGQCINDYVSQLMDGPSTNHWLLLDAAAGYIHTIFAAWLAGDNHILHRDISSGNLLVLGNSPRIIDWEYGLQAKRNDTRMSVSSIPLTGTMVYFSMRVLKAATERSHIDDLESMFYVLTHAIELACGASERGAQMKLWDSRLDEDELEDERRKWLASRDMYLRRLPERCPRMWRDFLGVLYDLLALSGEAGDFGANELDMRPAGELQVVVSRLKQFLVQYNQHAVCFKALERFSADFSKHGDNEHLADAGPSNTQPSQAGDESSSKPAGHRYPLRKTAKRLKRTR
ncbi:hypothetical protein GQ54DRAFT_304957 [Martensiomyces pterosporus]|nr:hypothetical protein GQ54DRAFT_304957 [Martensiomyces pterosporus]